MTRSKLDHLGIGMSIDYLVSLLGVPILRDRDVIRFQLQHAWVSCQVVDGAVAAFSVTLFARLRYRLGSICPPLHKYRLGATRLGQMPTLPACGIECGMGARRGYYREMHYLGNPGWYQYYVVASNDAGIHFWAADLGGPSLPSGLASAVGVFEDDPTGSSHSPFAEVPEPLLRFRAAVRPNTVTALREPDATLARRLEIDRDQIRVLWRASRLRGVTNRLKRRLSGAAS